MLLSRKCLGTCLYYAMIVDIIRYFRWWQSNICNIYYNNKLENEKKRKHTSIENEKERQNKLKIEEEKTKRLMLQLQNGKDKARIKLNQENSNSPYFILKMHRKTKKGKGSVAKMSITNHFLK